MFHYVLKSYSSLYTFSLVRPQSEVTSFLRPISLRLLNFLHHRSHCLHHAFSSGSAPSCFLQSLGPSLPTPCSVSPAPFVSEGSLLLSTLGSGLQALPPCTSELHSPHPAPVSAVSLHIGLLNVRSARHKIAQLHDLINDESLDILIVTETWIYESDPDVIKLGLAPSGYGIVHGHRVLTPGVSTDTSRTGRGAGGRRGGGYQGAWWGVWWEKA